MAVSKHIAKTSRLKTAAHVLRDVFDLLCSERRGSPYAGFILPENPLSPPFFSDGDK